MCTDDAKAGSLNAGQPAASYLCYMVSGEVAGGWGNFGGFGALLANLAHFLGPPIIQNAVTPLRF